MACCEHPESDHESIEYRGDKSRSCMSSGCKCKRFRASTSTALLPTSPMAVEDWLRSLANQSDLLRMKEAGQSEYPYLFGMATVKLAEAHAEYLRMLDRQSRKGGK